ncbi:MULTISPECIES: cyclic pyranopterin monophosphate synthase MoaC [Clostridium]|jgi:cyclic pyranopterin phosphate synthase|uniref:Cyclic pyranopterin monophosphate synthase n=1 Tax=Clostridium colicanis DSM 13634 TaxID=1121305 RepID=A0A151AL00_9CLOT|nr:MULTISPECIES: cyclic pyranopterin monophosphate synthase MoaC [Clostridium]KYH28275.1 cyclic pyranopterin monophosphate synthase accessory protein [Clostridium colicanis DSM 13634]MBE6043664.1 cyclic pyranopterin monophosphate synthase MoaC [Clostridium thermopalmarium]
MEFTHFNENGKARMVDVGGKNDTKRIAIARGVVRMNKETLIMVKEGQMKKGDVLAVAQVAGIMGAKRTSDVIPMCHNILINGVDLKFEIDEENSAINIEAEARTTGKTGVEMEALTAISIAALTIYDMCKAIDKRMVIDNIRLVKKTGGKSGEFIRKGEKI